MVMFEAGLLVSLLFLSSIISLNLISGSSARICRRALGAESKRSQDPSPVRQVKAVRGLGCYRERG